MITEDQLISLAIAKEQRSRYREKLDSKKSRAKFLDRLNHVPDLNPTNTKWYAKFQKAVDTINIEPQIKVYLLSASEEIDQKTVTFQEALEIVPKYGWGTLIGINNNLALYYDECGERGAVIRKKKI